ncbi:unnamed protein product [Ixodes persulcatus]
MPSHAVHRWEMCSIIIELSPTCCRLFGQCCTTDATATNVKIHLAPLPAEQVQLTFQYAKPHDIVVLSQFGFNCIKFLWLFQFLSGFRFWFGSTHCLLLCSVCTLTAVA